MERVATSLFLVFVGAGLLVLARGFWRNGELPAGSSGLKAYRPARADNPFGFHFFPALYIVGGDMLCMWGLLALFGVVPALPLH